MKRIFKLIIILILLNSSCQQPSVEVTQANIKEFNCHPSDISSDSEFSIRSEDETLPSSPLYEGVIAFHTVFLVQRFSELNEISCSLMVLDDNDSAVARWEFYCPVSSEFSEGEVAGDRACSIRSVQVNQTAFVYGRYVFLIVGTANGNLFDELVNKVDQRLKGELELPQTDS